MLSYQSGVRNLNTFHHLNEDVPIDHVELESRAESCVKALLAIESELFAFTINESRDRTHASPLLVQNRRGTR